MYSSINFNHMCDNMFNRFNKFNHNITEKCNYFKNNILYYCDNIYNKSKSHYVGCRSIYLFIIIIYKLKNFFENDKLLNDKDYLNDIKNNILECGCISIKFTQWIVSKLKGSNNNEKYEKIIDELEDIFDNCN